MTGSVVAEREGLIAIRFADDGRIPNSALPLIVYRQVLPSGRADAEAMEALLAAGGWPPRWRAGIFPYHHYHSTAHEVLGIASGRARVAMGGPQGDELEIAAGDVVIIPAGVGHKRLSSTPDFLAVGGYPPGQDWDLLRGDAGERPAADANLARVPLPSTDPVYGNEGPLLDLWK